MTEPFSFNLRLYTLFINLLHRFKICEYVCMPTNIHIQSGTFFFCYQSVGLEDAIISSASDILLVLIEHTLIKKNK